LLFMLNLKKSLKRILEPEMRLDLFFIN